MKQTFETPQTISRKLRNLGATPAEQLSVLSLAIDASNNCIVLSDARHPDAPLLYVNRGFERLTGYSADEAIGRNCRFLQNDDRDQPGRAVIRQAIAKGEDGSMFWNELYLSAVYDADGELRYFMGVQNDVTERVNHELQLREAVEGAMQDATWFTSAILDKLSTIRSGRLSGSRLDELTARERETLTLLSEGLSNPDIARELDLSENTVRNYVARIYDKLDVHSRAEAIVWARERGIRSGHD